ncbi:acetylxylan esterase [Phytoactinopolyspora limicola]|uniref:glucuronyl esterase domain-containing protein n=1 Tax=Phytoactinopolyspora limicola TaxID=2715536 RepID=UPI00140BD17C|nr:acetylxylan esterase [Phytoactinopolyspora limicola]
MPSRRPSHRPGRPVPVLASGGPARAETRRKWWSNWLGAERAPDAAWQLGPMAAWRDEFDRGQLAITTHGTTMEAALLRPAGYPGHPGRLATVVLPFYDVASLLGERSARTLDRSDERIRAHAYARHLVGHGVAVLAVPWWFEYVLPESAPLTPLAARYQPAAGRHRRTIGGTPLGRSIGDLLVAVDALASVPWIDPDRIGVFGHSLGGKLALFLAALDPRIAAGVVHEAGLGWANSNWSDPWYLAGDPPGDHDHDELLGLVAPRPILVAGGNDADGWHNRNVVEQASWYWPDTHGPESLYHNRGHTPPDHVLHASYRWLRRNLGR